MNDLVVLSLNNVNQVAVQSTAVVPYNPSLPSNNQGGFSDQRGSSERRNLPEPYGPALLNPDISYPELVGSASEFIPDGTPQTTTQPDALEAPAVRANPAAYEAVSQTYNTVAHAGDWVVGTTLNLEV